MREVFKKFFGGKISLTCNALFCTRDYFVNDLFCHPSISTPLAQHWHCFALLPQIYICYTWYSQKFCRRPFPIKRNGRFAVKVVVIIIIKKIRRILQDERAEANYFSTMVFIFIAVLLLAFIIDLFSIISTKQELDLCADQMVKQIQLSGGVNAETEQLFN